MGTTHLDILKVDQLIVGTTLKPTTTSVADTKFNTFYSKSTATTGDARSIYNKLTIAGIGGGGESLRSVTDILDVAAATAHGAHLSLTMGTTGHVTGLGVAARHTWHVPNALSNGTYAATQSEIWGEGATSSVSGAAEASFHRFVIGGTTADVKATMDTSGFLFSIQGLTVGSGKLFQVNTAAAASHALRIKIGATPYYIMLTATGA